MFSKSVNPMVIKHENQSDNANVFLLLTIVWPIIESCVSEIDPIMKGDMKTASETILNAGVQSMPLRKDSEIRYVDRGYPRYVSSFCLSRAALEALAVAKERTVSSIAALFPIIPVGEPSP